MPLDQQGFVLPEVKPTIRELPDKLSDLLFLALKDLERGEANCLYHVNMSIWHDPAPRANGEARCVVCFAGVVMAHSLGASPEVCMRPGLYTDNVRDKLYALNVVRCGLVEDALRQMRCTRTFQQRWWGNEDITPYNINPARFKAEMHDLAKRLEAEGY